MQKVTVFTLLCMTSAPFAMNKPNNTAKHGARESEAASQILNRTIPFKKNQSGVSDQSYLSKMIELGKTLGKVALCVSAVFLPSIYSDVTIDYMTDYMTTNFPDLGLVSVQTLVPAIVYSTNTVLASLAAFKCVDIFSSHRGAHFVASTVAGGATALYSSGQLERAAGYVGHASHSVLSMTDQEYIRIIKGVLDE